MPNNYAQKNGGSGGGGGPYVTGGNSIQGNTLWDEKTESYISGGTGRGGGYDGGPGLSGNDGGQGIILDISGELVEYGKGGRYNNTNHQNQEPSASNNTGKGGSGYRHDINWKGADGRNGGRGGSGIIIIKFYNNKENQDSIQIKSNRGYDGVANTGSGGGGGEPEGIDGDGGSGVVIIKYKELVSRPKYIDNNIKEMKISNEFDDYTNNQFVIIDNKENHFDFIFDDKFLVYHWKFDNNLYNSVHKLYDKEKYKLNKNIIPDGRSWLTWSESIQGVKTFEDNYKSHVLKITGTAIQSLNDKYADQQIDFQNFGDNIFLNNENFVNGGEVYEEINGNGIEFASYSITNELLISYNINTLELEERDYFVFDNGAGINMYFIIKIDTNESLYDNIDKIENDYSICISNFISFRIEKFILPDTFNIYNIYYEENDNSDAGISICTRYKITNKNNGVIKILDIGEDVNKKILIELDLNSNTYTFKINSNEYIYSSVLNKIDDRLTRYNVYDVKLFNLDEWYLLVWTVDKINGKWHIYINDKLILQKGIYEAIPNYKWENKILFENFIGKIDSFRIYKKVLNLNEVKSIYNLNNNIIIDEKLITNIISIDNPTNNNPTSLKTYNVLGSLLNFNKHDNLYNIYTLNELISNVKSQSFNLEDYTNNPIIILNYNTQIHLYNIKNYHQKFDFEINEKIKLDKILIKKFNYLDKYIIYNKTNYKKYNIKTYNYICDYIKELDTVNLIARFKGKTTFAKDSSNIKPCYDLEILDQRQILIYNNERINSQYFDSNLSYKIAEAERIKSLLVLKPGFSISLWFKEYISQKQSLLSFDNFILELNNDKHFGSLLVKNNDTKFIINGNQDIAFNNKVWKHLVFIWTIENEWKIFINNQKYFPSKFDDNFKLNPSYLIKKNYFNIDTPNFENRHIITVESHDFENIQENNNISIFDIQNDKAVVFKYNNYNDFTQYKIKFDNGGTNLNAKILIVAGGGGGGMNMGGGGGAGGVIYYNNSLLESNKEYDIKVGKGGYGAPSENMQTRTTHPYEINGENGTNSSFDNYISIGGGYGGTDAWNHGTLQGYANSGGSGGGSSGHNCDKNYYRGGTSIKNQGNIGASGNLSHHSGGGGGAGEAGGKGSLLNQENQNGGDGLEFDILGVNYYWGGGGGGSGYTLTGGNGGLGGGGGGARGSTTGGLSWQENSGTNYNGSPGGGGGGGNAQTPGGNAGQHTGGGGGGGSYLNGDNNGGNGGSGIVIIRYNNTNNLQINTKPIIENYILGEYEIRYSSKKDDETDLPINIFNSRITIPNNIYTIIPNNIYKNGYWKDNNYESGTYNKTDDLGGDWIYIKMPKQIQLKKYIFVSSDFDVINKDKMPLHYAIFGCNNGNINNKQLIIDEEIISDNISKSYNNIDNIAYEKIIDYKENINLYNTFLLVVYKIGPSSKQLSIGNWDIYASDNIEEQPMVYGEYPIKDFITEDSIKIIGGEYENSSSTVINKFNGFIDDIKIYNTEISETNIDKIYNHNNEVIFDNIEFIDNPNYTYDIFLLNYKNYYYLQNITIPDYNTPLQIKFDSFDNIYQQSSFYTKIQYSDSYNLYSSGVNNREIITQKYSIDVINSNNINLIKDKDNDKDYNILIFNNNNNLPSDSNNIEYKIFIPSVIECEILLIGGGASGYETTGGAGGEVRTGLISLQGECIIKVGKYQQNSSIKIFSLYGNKEIIANGSTYNTITTHTNSNDLEYIYTNSSNDIKIYNIQSHGNSANNIEYSGGAGAGTANIPKDDSNGISGSGGNGYVSNITGSLVYYGGGGGGASWAQDGYMLFGFGGFGGGGCGTSRGANDGYNNGINGLGGGGVGGGNFFNSRYNSATGGGKGGTGTVIIRYLSSNTINIEKEIIKYKPVSNDIYNINIDYDEPICIIKENINLDNYDYIYDKYIPNIIELYGSNDQEEYILIDTKYNIKENIDDYIQINNNSLYKNYRLMFDNYTNINTMFKVSGIDFYSKTENIPSYNSTNLSLTKENYDYIINNIKYIKKEDINIYPPIRNFTSKITNIQNNFYGNGKYYIWTSSEVSGLEGYNLFNHMTSKTFRSDDKYNNIGSYIGNNTIDGIYYGEWIKIKLPIKIYLKKYKFEKKDIKSFPAEYKIYASNNNIDWDIIVDRSKLTIVGNSLYNNENNNYTALYDNDVLHKRKINRFNNSSDENIFYIEEVDIKYNYKYYSIVVNRLINSSTTLKYLELIGLYLYGSVDYENEIEHDFYQGYNLEKIQNITQKDNWIHVKHISKNVNKWYNNDDLNAKNIYGDKLNDYNNWSISWEYPNILEMLFVLEETNNAEYEFLRINSQDINLIKQNTGDTISKSISIYSESYGHLYNENYISEYNDSINNNPIIYISNTKNDKHIVYKEYNEILEENRDINLYVLSKNTVNNFNTIPQHIQYINQKDTYYIEFKYNNNSKDYTEYTFNISQNINADILIIGGGGGGCRSGGGGGAGCLIYDKNVLLNSGNYTLRIGRGGKSSIKDDNLEIDTINELGTNTKFIRGENGINTNISYNGNVIYNAQEGGGGINALQQNYYKMKNKALKGGSGGGGGGSYRGGLLKDGNIINTEIISISNNFDNEKSNKPNYNSDKCFGNRGGIGRYDSVYTYCGGGGGAGGIGGDTYNVVSTETDNDKGYGGIGIKCNITGTNKYYAGGGGGSNISHNKSKYNKGGLGGGGDSGSNNILAKSGENGTGGGGGGSINDSTLFDNGGDGGSGLIIIKYNINISNTELVMGGDEDSEYAQMNSKFIKLKLPSNLSNETYILNVPAKLENCDILLLNKYRFLRLSKINFEKGIYTVKLSKLENCEIYFNNEILYTTNNSFIYTNDYIIDSIIDNDELYESGTFVIKYTINKYYELNYIKSSINNTHILSQTDDHLIAWYRFDNNFEDSINNNTIINRHYIDSIDMLFTKDCIVNNYSLLLYNNYIILPITLNKYIGLINNDLFNYDILSINSYSICFWCKFTSNSDIIFSSNNTTNIFKLSYNSSKLLWDRKYNYTSGDNYTGVLLSCPYTNTNEWTHISLISIFENNKLYARIFINNIEQVITIDEEGVNNFDKNDFDYLSNINIILAGCYADVDYYTYSTINKSTGIIQFGDIRFYDKSLTTKDISKIYNVYNQTLYDIQLIDNTILSNFIVGAGGGGGGGDGGGGGGAGSIFQSFNTSINNGIYNLFVGKGGYGYDIYKYGNTGFNTEAFDIITYGGGGGGGGNLIGLNGGSGGGGGWGDKIQGGYAILNTYNNNITSANITNVNNNGGTSDLDNFSGDGGGIIFNTNIKDIDVNLGGGGNGIDINQHNIYSITNQDADINVAGGGGASKNKRRIIDLESGKGGDGIIIMNYSIKKKPFVGLINIDEYYIKFEVDNTLNESIYYIRFNSITNVSILLLNSNKYSYNKNIQLNGEYYVKISKNAFYHTQIIDNNDNIIISTNVGGTNYTDYFKNDITGSDVDYSENIAILKFKLISNKPTVNNENDSVIYYDGESFNVKKQDNVNYKYIENREFKNNEYINKLTNMYGWKKIKFLPKNDSLEGFRGNTFTGRYINNINFGDTESNESEWAKKFNYVSVKFYLFITKDSEKNFEYFDRFVIFESSKLLQNLTNSQITSYKELGFPRGKTSNNFYNRENGGDEDPNIGTDVIYMKKSGEIKTHYDIGYLKNHYIYNENSNSGTYGKPPVTCEVYIKESDNIIKPNTKDIVIENEVVENNKLYKILIFKNDTLSEQTEYQIEFAETKLVDIFLVGGGGAGSECNGGGGGAGSVIFMKDVFLKDKYKIKVGDGGYCLSDNTVNGKEKGIGLNGNSSQIINIQTSETILAEGGGGGGGNNNNGANGGSGGGADAYVNNANQLFKLGGKANQYIPKFNNTIGIKYGTDGGNAFYQKTNTDSDSTGSAGGGGGAGEKGYTPLSFEPSNGGLGIYSVTYKNNIYIIKDLFNITNDLSIGHYNNENGFIYFAGGGGAGYFHNAHDSLQKWGYGALGGGGDGGNVDSIGINGINNTGGGGGGGGKGDSLNTTYGGKGGSGVVIIKYLIKEYIKEEEKIDYNNFTIPYENNDIDVIEQHPIEFMANNVLYPTREYNNNSVFLFIDGSSAKSWQQIQDLSIANGNRIPTKTELLNYLSSINYKELYNGDTWVPVIASDYDNGKDWIQLSNDQNHYVGKSHTDNEGKYPDWGDTTTSFSFRRLYIEIKDIDIFTNDIFYGTTIYDNGKYETSYSSYYNANQRPINLINIDSLKIASFMLDTYNIGEINSYYSKNNYIRKDYLGEWFKINLPYEIQLTKSVFITNTSLVYNAPYIYEIYGSKNNSDWEILYQRKAITSSDTIYIDNKVEDIIQTDNYYINYAFCCNAIGSNQTQLKFINWKIYGSRNISEISHCELRANKITNLTGWNHVKHISPYNTHWYTGKDKLQFNTKYGNSFDYYNNWAINYNDFDEILFVKNDFDKWLYIDYSDHNFDESSNLWKTKISKATNLGTKTNYRYKYYETDDNVIYFIIGDDENDQYNVIYVENNSIWKYDVNISYDVFVRNSKNPITTNKQYIKPEYINNTLNEYYYEFIYNNNDNKSTLYNINIKDDTLVDLLVVGGGGSGGSYLSGGGGGGNVVYHKNITLTKGEYEVKIGKGGNYYDTNCYDGYESSFINKLTQDKIIADGGTSSNSTIITNNIIINNYDNKEINININNIFSYIENIKHYQYDTELYLINKDYNDDFIYLQFIYISEYDNGYGQTIYTLEFDSSIISDILVVAGGGAGGGGIGGGGGAGGVLFGKNKILNNIITIKVGKGGDKNSNSGIDTGLKGENGTNSEIIIDGISYIINGGGGGSARNPSPYNGTNTQGNSGGSGGGGGHCDIEPWNNNSEHILLYYSEWETYGNKGGYGRRGNLASAALGTHGGGGGGGAGSIGENGGGTTESIFGYQTSGTGGDGGMGINFIKYFGKEFGDNGWFAGGGGGCIYGNTDSIANFGNGYSIYQEKFGGGGKGGNDGTECNPMNGLQNTGGGGGGGRHSNSNPGSGGSGIVLIRIHKGILNSTEIKQKYDGISNSGKSGAGASIIPINLDYNSDLQKLITARRNQILTISNFDQNFENGNIDIKYISVLNNNNQINIEECIIFKYIDPIYNNKLEKEIYNISKSKIFDIEFKESIQCDFLIVAGGGGGGIDIAGGGGGGNVIIGKKHTFEIGNYNFLVGNGGFGAPSAANNKSWPFGQDNQNSHKWPYTGLNGQNSFIENISNNNYLFIAKGGGYGASSPCNFPPDYGYSADGGCGGGRSGYNSHHRYNNTRPSHSIIKNIYSSIIWEYVGKENDLLLNDNEYINNIELSNKLFENLKPDNGDIKIKKEEYDNTSNSSNNIYIKVGILDIYKRKKLNYDDSLVYDELLCARYLFDNIENIGYDQKNKYNLIQTNCTISTQHIKNESSLFINSNGKGIDGDQPSFITFPDIFNIYDILQINNELSICFWYRIMWTTGNNCKLINLWDSDNNKGLSVGKSGSSSNNFNIKYNDIDQDFIPHTNNIDDGEWHFIVINIKDNDKIILYIDGDEKIKTSTGILPSDLIYDKQYIGKSNLSSDGNFTAYYEDFRIYEKVLNNYEIDEIYENKNIKLNDGKQLMCQNTNNISNNIYIYGNRGGGCFQNSYHYPGGGGGAGERGYGLGQFTSYESELNISNRPHGGKGIQCDIIGYNYYWAGGGGGSHHEVDGGNGGNGGGGAGASTSTGTIGGKLGYNDGENSGDYDLKTEYHNTGQNYKMLRGGNGGKHTGGGGGGGKHYYGGGGKGGSGIIVIRYKYEIEISKEEFRSLDISLNTFSDLNTSKSIINSPSLNSTDATGIFRNAKIYNSKNGGKSDENKWGDFFTNLQIKTGAAGGGGGALSDGGNGKFDNNNIIFGLGGDSIGIDIKNQKTYYGGGGGGGAYFENITTIQKYSLGGYNSGGNGGISDNYNTIIYPQKGIENTGGGGGGGDKKTIGGNGANGVVIIKYKTINKQSVKKIKSGFLNYNNDNKWDIVEELPLSLLTIPKPEDDDQYPVFLRYNFINSLWETKNILHAPVNNFTGQHITMSNDKNLNSMIGYIVCSDNTYHDANWKYSKKNLSKNIDIIQSLPYVKLSDKKNQKSVIGVVSNKQQKQVFEEDITLNNKTLNNQIIINSLGEGAIWVSNYNGNISNGDYITTSEIPGIGMKQEDDLSHNFTVAKITMDCDFNPKKIPLEKYVYLNNKIQFDENGDYLLEYELDINNNIIYEYEYQIKYIEKNGIYITEEDYIELYIQHIIHNSQNNEELKTYLDNNNVFYNNILPKNFIDILYNFEYLSSNIIFENTNNNDFNNDLSELILHQSSSNINLYNYLYEKNIIVENYNKKYIIDNLLYIDQNFSCLWDNIPVFKIAFVGCTYHCG